MATLLFHGAAQTVTGSCVEMDWAGRRILLDCGLFQGRREEASGRNQRFSFDAGSVDAVVLSHAHLDHSGRLPALVRNGFRGPVYATLATRDLCDMLLRDSARLQIRDAESRNATCVQLGISPSFEPLYDEGDVERAMTLFRVLEYAETVPLAPGLNLTLNDAGHVLGSATICLDYSRDGKPRRLLFTGDVGQGGMPLLRDPVPVSDVAVLITESTYADRCHPVEKNINAQLLEHLSYVARNQSKLVIPAFSVGRTQQLLLHFSEIFKDNVAPDIPVYVDSPMARAATQAYEIHRRFLNSETQARMAKGDNPFTFPNLSYTSKMGESRRIQVDPGPMVIISASGMCAGGRVMRHIRDVIADPVNIVLMVEFQAKGTLGRCIAEGRDIVQIRGKNNALKAKIHFIDTLSGHADSQGLRAFFGKLGNNIQTAFCVHGEPASCRANAKILTSLGVPQTHVPVPGQQFENV